MRKNCGNSLSQYSIIIALVILAIVPVAIILGKTIVSCFHDMSAGLNPDEQIPTVSRQIKQAKVIPQPEQPNNIPVTQGDNFIRTCTDGKCDIDFGNMVLKGIPDDFQTFVGSGGTSGGTSVIADVLQQISVQVSDPKIADLIQKLANYGHGIAKVEKNVETLAQGVIDSPKEVDFDDASNLDIEDSVAFEGFEDTLEIINEYYSENKTSPEAKEARKIVSLLSSEILSMANNLANISSAINMDETESVKVAQQIVKPKTSTTTDLDSAIICTTGNHEDSGIKCK